MNLKNRVLSLENKIGVNNAFCACDEMTLEEWKRQSDEMLSSTIEDFNQFLDTYFPVIENDAGANICQKCGKEFDGSKPTPNEFKRRARQRFIEASETMAKHNN